MQFGDWSQKNKNKRPNIKKENVLQAKPCKWEEKKRGAGGLSHKSYKHIHIHTHIQTHTKSGMIASK